MSTENNEQPLKSHRSFQNCSICGSTNTSEFFDDVTRCIDCDAIFRNTIFESRKHFVGNSRKKENRLQMKFWDLLSRPYIKYLKEKTDMDFKNVLDIGTYFGHFVKMMNKEGCNTHGIEPDECRISQAVTNKISQGYFDHIFSTDEKYDLICFNEMLYYLPHGIQALNHARTMLTDRGIIFITTLNPSSSLIKNKILRNIGSGIEYVNCFMSRKNFESLEGFKMIDYSCFKSNMLLDMHMGRKYMFPLYFFGFKKINTFDSDGNKAFILLEKSE